MVRQITKRISFLLLFVSISFFSYSQTTTVTFNEIPTTNSANSLNGTNTYNNSGVKFQIFSGSNPSAFVSYTDNGFNNTKALDDNNTVIGGVKGWKITKVDGTAFQLTSIWLQNGCAQCSASGTIKAFSGGVQVGSTVNVAFDSQSTGVKNFGSNTDFYNIDEIRIEGADLYVYIDDFSFGPAVNPVDTDPPLVTSISLVGSPLTNATSVNYSVTFSKDAKNVSSDDFQVTTAGTTGSVGAVSGSGSSYTVAVNNLDGEGTVRLDLKGGTNIANVDDITGTPAFTSGQLHYVGACFVETFETETDASTTFSGNGVSFSLGTGFEIEKRTGFGSGKSNGYIKNNNTAGSFSLSSATEFTMSTIDLFLSDQTNGDNPTATGSISITGKKGGVDQYTITKNSGFPTTTTNDKGGFFTINFSTDGASNYRNINVDELVFTISGGFIELLVDNFNFCEEVPFVDTQAPVVQSISKTGTSLSTAGTVNFQVTFDEDASNVTLDDFTLLRTGTATGALTGISGSGSSYTLSVTGISGEGSVQIKLNSGTNIQDALGNTPPFEFLNGEIHLVGACYIETFESFTNGAISFSSNGKAITLGGNWAVKDRTGFGINSSSNYLENTGAGPYTLSVDIPVKFSKLALFLTSNTGTNPLPTNDGTVTIRGKNGATTEYTITKSTGFPTDFSSNKGFFFIDFATEGGVDNSTTFVDGLEIEIGGSFIYLALDNLQFCSDFEAPTSYTVSIDQDPIKVINSNAVSFTFAGAEIGTTYNYTFSSDGGGTNVTGSGIIASATDQITGIDLSGLGVGTVTLSVTLTDPSGNTGSAATDTKQKIANQVPVATAPTAPVLSEDDVAVALADDIQVADGDGEDQTLTFTITGGTVTLGTTGITFGGSGNGSASFTAAGTLAALNTALDAATFTPTPDLYGTGAGTISFVSNDGLVNSNTASVTFDIAGVNDDPTITGLPSDVLVQEDVASPLDLTSITLDDKDSDSGSLDLVLSASSGTMTMAASAGISFAGNATDRITISGSSVNLNAYLDFPSNILYLSQQNLNGDNAATIAVSINDNGNTGIGGGSDVSTGSINVDITPVNDDPTLIGLPTDISVQENLASDVDLSAATFGDVDAGSNNIDLEITANVGTLTGSGGGLTVIGSGTGTLTLNGTAATIDAYLNSASNIQYTGPIGTSGDNAARLDLTANDGGNTGTGGGINVALGSVNVDIAAGVTQPDVPTLTVPVGIICEGSTVSISISGNLNDATQWAIYTGSCGGTLLGTTTSGSFDVIPTSPSTTYYVRGEGGAIVPGTCGSITINTASPDDASFSYSSSSYCVNDADPSPTITGIAGGTFSNTPIGLSINASSGRIDVSASNPGIYTVTYTTAGSCPNNSSVSLEINALDNPSFNYDKATYGVNEIDPSPTITGLGGGTFSSTTGLSINAATGTIDLSASRPGGYVVTYTTNGSCPNAANVLINIVDPISISINDPSISEGNSGTSKLTFTVSLSSPAPVGDATVDYFTLDGNALAGNDYTAIGTTTLTFAAGETSKTIDVTIIGDETVEQDETLTLSLANPTGTLVTISDNSGTGTIINDDQATVNIANVSVDENGGTAIMTLTLDNDVDGGFEVDVSTADGTATTADSDYTSVASQTLTFAGRVGETQTFEITLGGDTKVEADETATISMSNLISNTVASGDIDITDGATLTILNDDIATVTIANVSGKEDDGAITVTAILDNAVDVSSVWV